MMREARAIQWEIVDHLAPNFRYARMCVLTMWIRPSWDIEVCYIMKVRPDSTVDFLLLNLQLNRLICVSNDQHVERERERGGEDLRPGWPHGAGKLRGSFSAPQDGRETVQMEPISISLQSSQLPVRRIRSQRQRFATG